MPDLQPMTEDDRVSAVPAPSGTVTFLFSDIEGSTRRWARDRAAMQEAVRVHDRLMREAIAASRGYVFKTIGDAFCAAFPTPESAVEAALAIQRALGATDFSAVDGLRVRMALNTGTADERDGDYFGPALNRVARLLALGNGGQVLLSSRTAGLVRENPPPHVTLVDLGEQALKDLEGFERPYQLVAPGLLRDFPALRSPKAVPWLVPDAMRTSYFTGRDELLARLRQTLLENHRAALSGLGGVGKTQTAIEYAARYRTEYPSGVFWVNAETASNLTRSFVEIAKALHLPAAEVSDQELTAGAVLDWLNGTAGWLLILDNVDDRRDVRPFVPAREKGDLLITSRESVFPELGIPRALAVADLAGDEAVRFLLARTGRDDAESDDRVAAAELASALGSLPLALEQAAAYIAETNAAFSAYLTAFRKRRVALLEKAGGLVAHDTVAVTWAANFEAVERLSPAAADILRISGLLAPDAIPFELFLDGAQAFGESIAEALADPDDLTMAEVLRPLARYSLIRSDATSRAYSMHRLVQDVVWTATPAPDRPRYVERTARALHAVFPQVEYANWTACERLVTHVVSLAGTIDEYGARSEAAAEVLNRTAGYLSERGRYDEAVQLHRQAIAIVESLPDSQHAEPARWLDQLATVYQYQGRYAEAQALMERAHAILERSHGPDDPDLAVSLNALGNIHMLQGRYSEARPNYERAATIWERALGPDHPHVALGLNNLGVLAFEEGRYDEALPLYERALAIRERALGPDHPYIVDCLGGLANVQVKMARFAEAQPLYERALEVGERTVGPDHEDAAYVLDGLASLNALQGRYAEAKALYERALGNRERALGPDHPHVAESADGLAGVHLALGDYARADALYSRALTIRLSAMGPEYPGLAVTFAGLARVRERQGNNAEAADLFARALALRERTFGGDHPEVAELRANLAAARSSQA